MNAKDPYAKERIETYSAIGQRVGQCVGKRLGTDERGRHLDFFPVRGEIVIRERDGLDHVVYDRVDLDSSTVRTYCHWVETACDVDVEWTDAAPAEVRD